jgi:hypothetical protein
LVAAETLLRRAEECDARVEEELVNGLREPSLRQVVCGRCGRPVDADEVWAALAALGVAAGKMDDACEQHGLFQETADGLSFLDYVIATADGRIG